MDGKTCLLFKKSYALLSEEFENRARQELVKELDLSNGQHPTRPQIGEKIQYLFQKYFNELAMASYSSEDKTG